MKINRRLINIAIASLVASLVLTFFIFSTIKKAAAPEPTQRIGYFKNNTEDVLLKIADVKGAGNFELVSAPEGYSPP